MNRAITMAAAFAAVSMTPTVAFAATDIPIGTDGSWTITDGDGNPLETRTPTNSEIPSVWDPSVPGSQWISPNLGNGAAYPDQGTSPAGLYSFIGVFDLSDIGNVQTWNVTWWSDNIVRQILVNGIEVFANATGDSLSQEFRAPGISNVFKTNSAWKNGDNTVTFVVENGSGLTGNPTGLRVAGLLSAVPEPGTWMLMILGLGAVGFAMRRRQASSVRLQFA